MCPRGVQSLFHHDSFPEKPHLSPGLDSRDDDDPRPKPPPTPKPPE